ncbi:DUF6783 domain-containing protein [Blautia sp. HCP3S3_G3]
MSKFEKFPAKWGVHLSGMNFQTRSRVCYMRTIRSL